MHYTRRRTSVTYLSMWSRPSSSSGEACAWAPAAARAAPIAEGSIGGSAKGLSRIVREIGLGAGHLRDPGGAARTAQRSWRRCARYRLSQKNTDGGATTARRPVIGRAVL